jgi:uncharacterized protein
MHVFEHPYALFERDRTGEAGDLRWQAIGLAGGIAQLLVAHTVREEGEEDVVRIVSTRRATRKERNRYDETGAPDAG